MLIPTTVLEQTGVPGSELDYSEITSPVTVSATTAASPDNVVSLPARSYDGSTVIMLEFFAPIVSVAGGTTTFLFVMFFDDTTEIGRCGTFKNNVAGASVQMSAVGRLRITPSNASHTYSVKAYRAVANCVIGAGTGVGDTDLPAFIRAVVIT